MKKLLLIITLLLLASPVWATTYYEDFDGGGASWAGVTPNEHQCTIQTIGDLRYGWYGCGSSPNFCEVYPGSYWAYSTEQAHSGTHSMKHKYPRNVATEGLPRIYWWGPDHGVTYTEFYCGGWFYIPSDFTLNDLHKWINLRFNNGDSRVLGLNGGSPSGIWWAMALFGGSTFPYPQGSPSTQPYIRLWPCNADGSTKFLARGQWHSIKIYMKLVASPVYTDTLKIWIDGEIATVKNGCPSGNPSLTGPNVRIYEANFTDIELGGDILTHMTWNLTQVGGLPDADYYVYWDDIFLGDTPPDPPDPPGNLPPVLAGVGNKSVVATETLTFVVSATDPNGGDVLTYSATGLPTGATFTAATATFAWTPTAEQGGTYTGVTFTVVDDGTPQGTDSEAITITVGAANQAPVLGAIGNKTVAEGAALSFTVEATDPDGGQTVTLSSSTLPDGATFTVGTGAFAWTPGSTQSGSYEMTFTATDNGSPALHADEIITIAVTNVNAAPVMGAIGDGTIEEGHVLTFQVTHTDPDGDPCTCTAENLPTGMTETSECVYSWTPTLTQEGSYPDVVFTVTDNGTPGLTDTETITITVNEFMPAASGEGGESMSGGTWGEAPAEPGVGEPTIWKQETFENNPANWYNQFDSYDNAPADFSIDATSKITGTYSLKLATSNNYTCFGEWTFAQPEFYFKEKLLISSTGVPEHGDGMAIASNSAASHVLYVYYDTDHYELGARYTLNSGSYGYVGGAIGAGTSLTTDAVHTIYFHVKLGTGSDGVVGYKIDTGEWQETTGLKINNRTYTTFRINKGPSGGTLATGDIIVYRDDLLLQDLDPSL